MRQQRLTTLVAAALVAAATAGCSGDDAGPRPRAETPPSTIAELVEDASATAAVSGALAALREGNSGTFTTHVEYADLTFDYYGSYRLEPPQQRVSLTADLEDGPVQTEAVGDAGAFFVRLPPDGPVSSPCWVAGSPPQIADAIGVETNPDFNRFPGAIGLVSTATGVAYAGGGDDVLGSVNLATAMALVSPRLPALLGLVEAPDRVLATFSLDDGTLSGISVTGPAILAALDQAGAEADPDELADVFGAGTPIEVTLSDSGAEVIIEAPPPAAVIDLSAPDARARIEDCG